MAIKIEYEKDYYSWLMKNAGLLRDSRFSEIDADRIAEGFESMGRSEKRELINRLSVLIAHLLKWQYQAVRRSRSWRNPISTQRIDIQELLENSPSIRHEIGAKIDKSYEKARLMAEGETGIDKENFPTTCPFSLKNILNADFFPENR